MKKTLADLTYRTTLPVDEDAIVPRGSTAQWLMLLVRWL